MSGLPGEIAASRAANDGVKQGDPLDFKQAAAEPTAELAGAPTAPPGMTAAFEGYLRLVGDGAAEFTEYPGWKLSESEIRELAAALEACRLKYFPDLGGESGPELRLIIGLIGSFGVRFWMYKKHQREKLEAAEKARRESERKNPQVSQPVGPL